MSILVDMHELSHSTFHMIVLKKARFPKNALAAMFHNMNFINCCEAPSDNVVTRSAGPAYCFSACIATDLCSNHLYVPERVGICFGN